MMFYNIAVLEPTHGKKCEKVKEKLREDRILAPIMCWAIMEEQLRLVGVVSSVDSLIENLPKPQPPGNHVGMENPLLHPRGWKRGRQLT